MIGCKKVEERTLNLHVQNRDLETFLGSQKCSIISTRRVTAVQEDEDPSQIWDMGKVFNINLKILDSTFSHISHKKISRRCKSFSAER